ncbi:hypothetical protein H4W80_001255 [Nonomuraea angiospora]|uniref:Uncharacterized protein n=1 Tax=Nonomuraea angiospora TaxID=46172 RepID=A0ABR9LQS3_9ACTN|nr:hypothetical protein [Nonomuraea angiospora]MBE1582997.1 hypothetical protein [Nonomuraea angiospora]
MHAAFSNFTDADREASVRIEALTDELAAPAYDVLSADELDELVVARDHPHGVTAWRAARHEHLEPVMAATG